MRDGPIDRAFRILRDPADRVAAEPPVRWAIDRLRAALEDKGVSVSLLERSDPDEADLSSMLVAGSGAASAREILARADISVPKRDEALGLVPGRLGDHEALLACGTDVRGLVYAVLELADRVRYSDDPLDALRIDAPIIEEPANAVRSVARLFVSEVNDKPWFNDEDFWRRYLSMLISQRFNRFSLTLGLGYNFPRHVTDAYLYFAYPFLLSVPAHDVRVPQLPDEERERNLQTLRFISDESVARGLDFQLGLWTHAYEWIDSPNARHTIEGLTPEGHAAYCRDALQALLERCPAIGGVTFRIHGESGIVERSWDFWRTVLDGVVRSGRPVGIDLHAKGLDAETLRAALETGLPVTVSPKYWAEHMGLPYHQAGIRELERAPKVDRPLAEEWTRYMSVSVGSRPFTRYGYGDFLREDRAYDVVFRLWPGTQRLLLWGDPAMAAGFGRRSSIAGSQGLEWCEPLSFKGREGSGLPGPRDGYADRSLSPRDDWEKHEYTYRLFGRLTYDPDAPADAWRRYFKPRFGSAAGNAEAALASASRILPLVTTAHHPSASNNYYWPEIYTDMPIVARDQEPPSHPYIDTPIPRRFGTVSPLDPEVFSSVEAFVREELSGERSGRYSPLEVARWLEQLSDDSARRLEEMRRELVDPIDAWVRRLVLDVAIQSALGRFFAGKLRAAVLYELATQVGSQVLLADALEAYRAARAGWADAAEQSSGAYVADLTFGPEPFLRGHWSDRLAQIDRDIEDMAQLSGAPLSRVEVPADEARRLAEELGHHFPQVEMSHTPPASFRPGEEITIALLVYRASEALIDSTRLRYRHMDQSRSYEEVQMVRRGNGFVANIPGGYSDSAYPVQYLFVLRGARGIAWRYPDLGAELSNQPYFVTRPDTANEPGPDGPSA